ncbi:MFS transporter, partial [Roseateles sp. GG27B]
RIEPAARSRLNAVLFVGMFTGMASGALLGSVVLGHFGWQGVCVMAAGAGLAALLVRLWPQRAST